MTVPTPPDARGGDAADAPIANIKERVSPMLARLGHAEREVVRLEAALDAARRETEAVKAELEEARDTLEEEHGIWPEWAEACLKQIRMQSGYDGCDDAQYDGVDLPGELRELIAEFRAMLRAVQTERDALADMAGEAMWETAFSYEFGRDVHAYFRRQDALKVAQAARDAALAASERDRADNDQLRGALNQAEACMSIVAPRSNKDEYLRILAVVRVALTTTPKVSHADA